MSASPYPSRAATPPEYTWDAASLFASEADWEAAAESVLADLPTLTRYQGGLAQGAAAVAAALAARDALVQRLGRVYVYANLAHSVDTADPGAARRLSQAQGWASQVFAAGAFLDPELLALGEDQLRAWLLEEQRLRVYEHYLHDLFRQHAHVRSAEVEAVLGLAAEPFQGVANTARALTDADLKFPPARGADGRDLPLTQGSIDQILAGPDREARRSAWEHYQDTHRAFQNTLASNLATSIKQNVFLARVRRHASTLEAALFANNIPPRVFQQLIDTFRRHLPTWHRYWRVRRQALRVETLHPYDIWAPLTPNSPRVPYRQAVDWICASLAPLGADYVETVRRGCLHERWVDVYPNAGKASAQFSSGWPGAHPFIIMNYDDTVFSLSTLTHELGHSLHSYLSWQRQPFIYAFYTIFSAEVASNFHQALLRAHLLRVNTDRNFQISLLEEALANFHRYFFIMPTLARLDLEVHQRAERGQGLTAEDLNSLTADLFAEGYGTEMHVDRERVGLTWATFGHLYQDYYVYQYATGIAGAQALAARVLAGAPGAVEAYRGFLGGGGSGYSLDLLRRAGVDLSGPEPVEAAFGVLADMVDRLEALTASPPNP